MTAETFEINKLTPDDFAEWSVLFKAYIDFYQTTIPEEQYRKTFDRILNPEKDLYALVMRQQVPGSEKSKMVAIAHFFPTQTPWSEENIMLLNGEQDEVILDVCTMDLCETNKS